MINFDDVDDDYSKKPVAKPRPTPPEASTPLAPTPPSTVAPVTSIDDIDLGSVRPSSVTPAVSPSVSVEPLPVPPVVVPVLPVEPVVMPIVQAEPVVPVAVVAQENVRPAPPSPPPVETLNAVHEPVSEAVVLPTTSRADLQRSIDTLVTDGEAWCRVRIGSDESQTLAGELSAGWADLGHRIAEHSVTPDDIDYVLHETNLWDDLRVSNWAGAHASVVQNPPPGPFLAFNLPLAQRLEQLAFARGVIVLGQVAVHAPSPIPSIPADAGDDVVRHPTPVETPIDAPEPVPFAPAVMPQVTVEQELPASRAVPSDAPVAKPRASDPTVKPFNAHWIIGGAIAVALLIVGGGFLAMHGHAQAKPATVTISPPVRPAEVTPTVSVSPAPSAPAAVSAPTFASAPVPTSVAASAPSIASAAVVPSPAVADAAPSPEVKAPVSPATPVVVTTPEPVAPVLHETPVRPHVQPSLAAQRAHEKTAIDAINAELDRKLKAAQSQ